MTCDTCEAKATIHKCERCWQREIAVLEAEARYWGRQVAKEEAAEEIKMLKEQLAAKS